MALKAVGGTAHGGLFLDCDERDLFLDKECATYDWGPNAQTGVAFPPKRTRRGPPRDDRQDLPILQDVGRHVW